MALHPSDYALIIGVNNYPFHTQLAFAHNDANAFKAWLIDTETGGGIPESNIALLLSEVRGEEVYIPSPQDVDVQLRKIISRALENQQQVPPRRFYLYFSGHGLGVKATDVGLCLPFWSKASNAGAMLKMSAYLNYLIDLGLFPEIFVFLDCCRNALQAPGGHEPSLSINKPNPGAATSQHLIAFATTYTNAAFEAEQNVGNNADENRGFFTSCLLEGLQGAAADSKGGVPLNKLLEYLDGRVPQLAASKGKTQKAAYSQTFNLTEMPEIILGAAKPPDKVSASKNINLFLFSVSKSWIKRDYELSILNEKFEVIYKGFDSFSESLPPGNYIVRSQMGDNNTETHVDHRGPETNIEAPELSTYSSVLLQGAQSSHEYYTNEAVYWSKNQTDAKLNGGSDSHLFFFARYPNKELASDYDLFNEMSLLDESLTEIHSFPQESYSENREYGWYAFSYSCKSGQYYLRFDGSPSRIIPVYCFPNWQTQLFVTLKETTPLLETLRILTARKVNGFQPGSQAEICDMAFEYLKNPELELPPTLAEHLLHQKFDNPMFGILGAYLVLQRKDEKLLSKMPIVIRNLERLLNTPDSVDLRAIQAIFNYKENKNLNFSHPPMIAFGSESLLLLENKKRVTISADSVFGRMTLSRNNDLVLRACSGI